MLKARIHKYEQAASWSYLINDERRVMSIYGKNRVVWCDALAIVHTTLLDVSFRPGMRVYQRADAAIFY